MLALNDNNRERAYSFCKNVSVSIHRRCLLSTLRSVASLNIFSKIYFQGGKLFENSEFYHFVKTQFSFMLLLSFLPHSNASINTSDIQSELHGSSACNRKNISCTNRCRLCAHARSGTATIPFFFSCSFSA